MSKLEKNLNEWVSQNFINEAQVKLILDYESAKSGHSWVLSGFLILGAVIIGFGLISVIASNRDNIPDFVRLGADFSALCALAAAVMWSRDKDKPVLHEVFLLLFILLCLASIGLISQIFHTGGSFWQALLFWSVICFMPVMVARRLFIPLLWTGSIVAVLFLSANDSSVMMFLFRRKADGILFALPLSLACLILILRRFAGEFPLTRALRVWMLFTGLAALAAGELRSRRFVGVHSDNSFQDLSVCFLFGCAALVLVVADAGYRRIQKGILVCVLLAYTLLFVLPLRGLGWSAVYAGLVVLTLGLFAAFMASLREMRIFHVLLFFAGLRFLVLFLEAIGGLAASGFGLMFSGLLIMVSAYLWNKHRNTIAARAEEWTR
ncbi:MAG: DUF2157 domain-containing protein [Proteobacteria bacterium]|nr:DUF2157 domain-containing protein [Pseudomonadota bacterium]